MKGWDVFTKTPELFILVPILLNLKGNLEMNLAARFSTAVMCIVLVCIYVGQWTDA